MCHFCVCFKHVEQLGTKRQRTENTKYYLAPFRKENYEKHNNNQHPLEWEKYKKTSKEKNWFFETMKSFSNLLYCRVFKIIFHRLLFSILSYFYHKSLYFVLDYFKLLYLG